MLMSSGYGKIWAILLQANVYHNRRIFIYFVCLNPNFDLSWKNCNSKLRKLRKITVIMQNA